MNPMQLVQMLQGSGNPMQMLMGMAQNNPALGQALQMVNGKTPAEMERMAYDMAKQRGALSQHLYASAGGGSVTHSTSLLFYLHYIATKLLYQDDEQ